MSGSAVDDNLEAISFRQLKLLETIGHARSVRQTSEQCNLSQPAVTQAIAKLEKLLGAPLLERSARGSFLTGYGILFHARTTRFFNHFHTALKQLQISGGDAALEAIANRVSRSQVRSLISLYDEANEQSAAASLSMCHASLMRAVRTLERNIGKIVLNRNFGGVTLTPAGMEFARRMKLALQEIESGKREIELEQGRENIRITIGAMPLGGSVLLASVIEPFLSKHPDVEVKIISQDAAELIRGLKAGNLDFVIGLVPKTVDPDLATEQLALTPFSVVARKEHPLSRKSEVSTQDLLECDWIIGAQGASRRNCFKKIFEGGPEPKATVRTSTLPIIRYLLQNSDRVALMTSYEILFEGDDLVSLDYSPAGDAPYIGITTRADWLPTKLQRDLMSRVRECTKSMSVGQATSAELEPAA